MELNILKEKENVFLNRKELEIEINHNAAATPSKAEIIKELSARYSAPEENIVINYILTKKGTNIAFVKAKIYKEKHNVKVDKNETQTDKSQ
jgi:ribosomal protein S24E